METWTFLDSLGEEPGASTSSVIEEVEEACESEVWSKEGWRSWGMYDLGKCYV